MATNFSAIKIGSFFKANGMNYKKADDLYYEDHIGMQEMWSPFFDETIDQEEVPNREITVKIVTGNEEPEFLIDPQSRIQKRNPKYSKPSSPAEEAMALICDSGYIGSDPSDYLEVAKEVVSLLDGLPKKGKK